MNIERVMPNCANLETELLSILLNDEQAIEEINIDLHMGHFYEKTNMELYGIMTDIHLSGRPVNIESVHYELSKREDLPKDLLFDISGQYVTSALAKEMSERIIETANLRYTIIATNEATSNAYENNIPCSDIIDKVTKKLYNVEQTGAKKDFIHVKEPAIDVYSKAIVIESKEDAEFIKTGFYDLDRTITGLPIGELTLLGARPACGKTTLGLQIGSYVSEEYPAGIVSLEMSNKQLVKRLISSESNINTNKFGTHGLNDIEKGILADAVKKIENRMLFIDDEPGQKISTICKKARKLKNDKDIKLLVIDYLQFIHPDHKGFNKNDEVSEISRTLKELAKELEISILCLSQLSRECEKRGGKKPMLSDLRDSGSLEQDAAVILFIWQDEVSEETKIIVGKNRFGSTGVVNLKFLKNSCRFGSLSAEYSDD